MKKSPNTPRSRVRQVLRLLWMRSRERHAALKNAGSCCQRCGVKASVAKGREVKVCVHHKDGINWDGVIDVIIAAMLPDPSRLECLCYECHAKEHADKEVARDERIKAE